MAVDLHIKIDTIPGNSEIKGFEGQIQLESFSWNMQQTTSFGPYHFNFHHNDLGNFTLIGPSGSGKTVVLGFLLAQARKFNPRIVKCEFCNHRLAEKGQPACTEVCPTGAVKFGTRTGLLAEAKQRIEASPGKYYQDRIYGEGDLGGTQVLYLSHLPFEKLGLPEVGTESRAHYGSKVHSVIYKGMAIPIVVYAVLVAAIKRRYKVMEEEAAREAEKTGRPEQL